MLVQLVRLRLEIYPDRVKKLFGVVLVRFQIVQPLAILIREFLKRTHRVIVVNRQAFARVLSGYCLLLILVVSVSK